ncbi:RNA ligase family protein [Cellulophaga phage phi19:3]|uniref:DNA ligase n=1 Tax=Cellulophaga phage phi19:3 TaxID=1327971 RepID=R9ZYK2_9CAUD|nr:RNA ligase family protein [Cellulophaga phage phi19:3]AGO47407.1 DNA ligase [Cellulophaga phage phi19:3]
MEFKKYQHLERFGTTEVQNIELGKTYIFPKIDGTNASVWLNEKGEIQAGSRNRHLTLEADNAGFYAWVKEQSNLLEYLLENPKHRLYGEWLVPHSLKTYKENAWRNFYVFDVAVDRDENEILHESDDKVNYLAYDYYKPLLEEKEINFISPISIITNASYEQLVNQLMKNVFLIEDGKGVGEGIVIKNYDFKNKYGRNTFAKIVTTEFKEKHSKVMGASEIKGKKMVELEIAEEFVTTALVEKVYAKIENDKGFNSRSIPQLLNTVYYDVVKEDAWNFVKKHKNPSINFKTLQHFVFAQVKVKSPHLF